MEHDFKAALERDILKARMWLETEPNAPKHFTKAGNESAREAIDKILRLADKLMKEPSEGMIKAARNSEAIGGRMYFDVFKAMRDELIKEVEC